MTTNGDTALFNNSVAPVSSTVNLDVANWNLLNLTFDTTNANSFVIGSTSAGANSLVLSSGGEVLETGVVTSPASETINAPVILEGSYTFENDSAVSASGLRFNGNISAGIAAPITLTLQGSSVNNNVIFGAISNGSSSASASSRPAPARGNWGPPRRPAARAPTPAPPPSTRELSPSVRQMEFPRPPM